MAALLPMNEGELLAFARESIARGSSSFDTASRLFDPATRDSATLLYAWCRHCDDVVDGQQWGHAPAPGTDAHAPPVDRRLAHLVEATERAVRGAPPAAPAFVALAEVVRRHRIPARFPLEHLSGFRMDAQARRYDSLDDTLDYCWRVAGVVGVMMAMVMGRRDDATLDRAADLGVAFQLTNIARDVIDDHAAGRLYLPGEWLDAEGVGRDAVGEPRHRHAVSRVASRMVEAAEPYYRSAGLGLAGLPWRSAWAVASARGVYREIGLAVRARGPAAWDGRIATSRPRKLQHLVAGALTAAWSRALPGTAPAPPRDLSWTRPRP